MAINSIAWRVGFNTDIHVCVGQTTRTLNDNLFIFDQANPNGQLATDYLAANPAARLTFNALFKGAPNAIGMSVDGTTGAVTVQPTLPPLRKYNFIIEITASDADGAAPPALIRVHIHKSVKNVALTPTTMTVRPSTAPLATAETTSYRLTVRATFDDDTMGDLTVGHGVTWSPSTSVNSDGRFILNPSDSVGSSVTLTATLPAALGGSSASATIKVDQAWASEPTMPKTDIIPGGGWPGTTLPEQAPNVLIMGDGFAHADAATFESIATEVVHFIKTDETVRPFDLLCTSMNFWRVLVEAPVRGISVRCEVSAWNSNNVVAVPAPFPPPSTGSWNLGNLVYAVGLPMPQDTTRGNSDLRSDWAVLVPDGPKAPTNATVSDDLITRWKSYGKRGFVDEIDGFPGMAYGAPPAADVRSSTPMLNLHDGRVGRAGMKPFFNALKSAQGVMVGTADIGTVWADRGTFPYDNTDLVVLITAHPGGRPVNYDGYIAMPIDQTPFKIQAKAVAGASNFTPNFTDSPPDVSGETSRIATHELGHSFGLGDEYVDFETPDTSLSLPFANLQLQKDVFDASNKIQGNLIRWNWLRVRKAAVVTGPPTDGPSAGSFTIPVVLGQGLQFAANDILLMRLRSPGVVIDFASKVVELQHTLQVVSRVTDSVVVTAATGSTVTLADLQAFTPGSILFMPVPMPSGMPGPTDPYARMVAKNVENLITSKNAPLYVRPPTDKVSDDDKNNVETQHPALDGLTPSLPGRPFCFKVKPSIVGLYGGGHRYASGVFHPTGAMCMMRNDLEDGAPFCAVCQYITVELINPFHHFEIDLDYADIYPLR